MKDPPSHQKPDGPKSTGARPGLVVALGLSLLLLGLAARRPHASSPRYPNPSGAIIRVEAQRMGTLWMIRASPTNGMSPQSARRHLEAALAEVTRVESIMSEWRPDSPISAINAAAGAAPIQVPDELRDIILRANEISRLSDGAFDITWRGMADLWRWNEPNFTPPGEIEINRARARVNFQRIVIQDDRVGLSAADMQLGLGGVAKGYGVDRAAATLRAAGIQNFMINGGGDIVTSGLNHGRPWRVGIRHPRKRSQAPMAVVDASDCAVVTSGDYEQSRIVNGARVHHILDPRTGRPAALCQSVTILAPRAEIADALATAVFVLGPEKGLELIAGQPRTEALIVDAQGRRWMTPQLTSRISLSDETEE